MKGHCNLYQIKDGKQFLGYSYNSEEFVFPEAYPISLVESNVDPYVYADLQIIALDEFEHGKRTRDKRLEDAGIKSFNDLNGANMLLKCGLLKASAYIRKAIFDKYADVIDFCNPEVIDEQ